MTTRNRGRSRTNITRRQALQGIGAGVTALTVGCAGSDDPVAETGADLASPPGPSGDDMATSPPDMAKPADMTEVPLTPAQLLAGIDAIVVLMMENRSFDHYLGALVADTKYPGKRRPDGLTGKESNPDPMGKAVTVFRMDNFTPADPPHGWSASHNQFNGGKNDGFVIAHAGASEKEAMGYHDRGHIPFYYALADRYTVCDRWFASVMGPTWPNRYYLHAGTSGGKKDNSSFVTGGPDTLWERLKDKGKAAKNYHVGFAPWFAGGFVGKLLGGVNPAKKFDDFFNDCKNGTLPPFSIIDPDYLTNDDHPSHNIQLGQALISTVVQAIAQSPQWSRTLLVITYDEHGGFHDHVPPPRLADDLPDFEQIGFRVPTLVIGPTVRTAHVESTQFDHTSVGATLALKHGLAPLSKRMTAANNLSACIDPMLVKNPAPPPKDLPKVMLRLRDALRFSGVNSQPELDHMVQRGQIPRHLLDQRSDAERTLSWLRVGQALGAVELIE